MSLCVCAYDCMSLCVPMTPLHLSLSLSLSAPMTLLRWAGSVAIGAQPHSLRGTLLGASQFLTMIGFDFIAPDETILPPLPLVAIPSDTFMEYVPAFEYRDNNEWPAQHNLPWAGALGYNGPRFSSSSRSIVVCARVRVCACVGCVCRVANCCL